ncbi:IclR family transcriptional regulator [Phreatobacter stygius]|uniref:IclR family transcriptional regulator n=1 Tax=Phreatobacter stygius TaxID=1940610 RepID=A0A4D7B597_9HYPH|nr:IclR family transcriptional regulator [Phreatobacter stygius]QCI63412.1 IclR family transcriptional regulator [Phreatobacter stygius]
MKTAHKTIRLLRQFTAQEPDLGVSDLARRLDMDRSGVHRILQTLVAENFVEQDPQTRLYRLGLGVLDLAAVRISQHGLLPIALPYLDRLRDETGETVALLVPDRSDAVCIAVVESRHSVRVGYDVGERIPLHGSAGGQALLAHMADDAFEAYCAAGLTRFTARTITERDMLRTTLDEIRRRGFAWAQDSYIEGVLSAAAPVLDPKQRIAGSIAVAGPAQRLSVETLPEIAAAALRVANAVTAEWAGLNGAGTQARIGLRPG